MQINLTCDVREPLEGIEKLLAEDLPFTLARFLTMQAQTGQEAARQLEGSGIFRLRNDWTVRNTKITPATKKSMVAEVYTDTSNRATGAGDYLLKQGEGGERVPVQGRQHIAIPTEYLRKLAGGENRPIPDWLRPRALLEYAEGNGKWTVVRGKMKGQQRASPKAVRGMYFFLVTYRSGAKGILARYVTDPREQVYPMYVFATSAHISKRFPMAEVVEKAVDGATEENFNRAAAEVLTNNLLKSGFGVRF